MIALLDLDETLVDRSAGFASWARSFVDQWSLPDDQQIWIEELDRAVTQREQFFDALCERFPQAGPPDRLWRVNELPLHTSAFPGVVEHLATLRSTGWRLMVVTNGRTETQVGKLPARRHRRRRARLVRVRGGGRPQARPRDLRPGADAAGRNGRRPLLDGGRRPGRRHRGRERGRTTHALDQPRPTVAAQRPPAPNGRRRLRATHWLRSQPSMRATMRRRSRHTYPDQR